MQDFEEDILNVTKDIKLNPRDAKLYAGRAGCYFMIGRYDNAIADYTKAIELNPKVADYYNARADIYLFKGQYDNAIADYTKVIELHMIDQYDKDIVYDKDIIDAAKALGLNPRILEEENLRRHTSPYRNRGTAYAFKGQYDNAIADYDKAIEMQPSFPEAYYFKARILATCLDDKYRDGSEALELAKKAVDLDPKAQRAQFWETLAAAYVEVGKFEDAIITQEKAIDLQKKQGWPKNMIDQGIERLKSFKAHQPWRGWVWKSN